jgi:ATP-binding cassette subfamily C (CFTR/MRP) protein 1
VIGASQVAARFGPAQRVWNEHVQRRMKATTSMISNMKVVRMLGLLDLMSELITDLRTSELRVSPALRNTLLLNHDSPSAPETAITTFVDL